MTGTDDIIDSIAERLRELHEEIRMLTAARTALDGRDAPATRRRQQKSGRPVASDKNGTGPPPAAQSAGQVVSVASGESSPPTPEESRVRAKPRRSRARKSVDVVAAGRLELLLSEHGAMTTSALAERANGNRDQILTALRALEAAGRIRRSGQRRSTRWHPITDEQRIQQRAAELAARSKRAGRPSAVRPIPRS